MSPRIKSLGALVVLLLTAASLGNIAAPVRPFPDIVPRTSYDLTVEPLPDLATTGMPTLARFRAAADRPPFRRGRRQVVLSGGGYEASDSGDELGRLLAIGLTPEDEIVLLNPADSNQAVLLRLGDEIKGWSVSVIERNYVRFTRAQQVVVLRLREPDLADGGSQTLVLGEAE